MIQFLIGLSTLNVNWLLQSLFAGMRLYNSPPLFFVAGIALVMTGFYSFKLRTEMLYFVLLILAWSTFAGIMSGFDTWHVRQTVAFVVAAVIWVFVYQEGWRKDIITLERTKVILAVYIAYLVFIQIEKTLGMNILAYLISCVFSHSCGGNVPYILAGRYPFFSEEPSMAVLAIATVMPFLAAQAVLKKDWYTIIPFALCVGVMAIAGGITAQAFAVFSMVFFFFPRATVVAIPALLGLIIVVAANYSHVLGEPGGVVYLVEEWFGGLYSVVDQGIRAGSYTSRAMNWLIGAQAFLSQPFTGLGIGGTQSFFYALDNAGYYIVLGAEQEGMIQGEAPAYSSPMVVRIPAELGIVGAVFIAYIVWKIFRFALRRDHQDVMLQYALLYALGVMLLSFCFAGELLNPCITAFIALLAQAQRRRAEAQAPVKAPATEPYLAVPVPQPGT